MYSFSSFIILIHTVINIYKESIGNSKNKLLFINMDFLDAPKSQIFIFHRIIFFYYSDTQIERNALMVDTYPKIQEFCANLGLDFQVIDMHWGIPDESQLDYSMEELCLSEIKNCQNLSLGPNFVVNKSYARLFDTEIYFIIQ